MIQYHEKIAIALEELAKAVEVQPAPPARPASPAPSTKVASAKTPDAFRRATGRDMPEEIATNPEVREIVEKLAASSLPVNELGEESDRPDRSARREVGGTREERRKHAFESFGEEIVYAGVRRR